MTLPLGTLSISDFNVEVLGAGQATRRTSLADVLAVTRPVEDPPNNTAYPGLVPMRWYDQNSPSPPAQGGIGWAYYNNNIRRSNCDNANLGNCNGNCSDCGNNGAQNCTTTPLVNGVDFNVTPDTQSWLQGNCNCACTFNCNLTTYTFACNCDCPWICACACHIDCLCW